MIRRFTPLGVMGAAVLLSILCIATNAGSNEEGTRAFSAEPIWVFDSEWAVKHVETADLNGDLIPDIIAGEYSNTYYGYPSSVYAINGATGVELWSYLLQDGVRSMTIGDVNNDGVADVIAGASYGTSPADGKVHAIDGTNGAQIWTYDVGSTIQTVAVADLNGDVYLDVVAGSFDDHIYGIDGETGALIWSTDIGGLWINEVSVGDVNGDGIDDVAYAHEYLAGWDNYLGVLDGTDGTRIWADTVEYVVASVVMADIDDDGQQEAIFGGMTSADQGHFWVRNGLDGTIEWQYSLGTVNHSNGQVLLYAHDVDQDSDLDLVVGTYIGSYEILTFEGDGPTVMMTSQPLDGYPKKMDFGDVDGDGSLEIIVSAGDRVQTLGAIDGKKLWYYAVAGTMYDVAVGDFDDDGITDVAGGGGADYSGSPPNPGKTVWALKTIESPLLWEHLLNEYGNALVIADLDGDDYHDVVGVTSLGDNAVAVEGATGKELWTWVGTANLYAVTAGDFNNNGQVDIAVAGDDDMVTALDGSNGTILWQFADMTNKIYRKCLKATDLNNDGSVDVIAGAENSTVYAINGESGVELWSTPIGAGANEITLVQMNGVGPLDVVVAVGTGASGEKVVVIDGEDGSILWDYVCPEGVEHVSAFDVTGDNIPDVAAAITPFGTKQVIMIDGATHLELWNTPLPIPSNTHGMAFGYINGDAVLDLIVPGNSSDKQVHALDGTDGSEIWAFATGGEINTVAVRDMDGDDQDDVIVGADDNGVYVIDGATGDAYWSYSTGGDVIHVMIGDISGPNLPSIAAITFDGDGSIYAFDSWYEGCNDPDGDLLCDEDDNCPLVYNPGQEDTDGNGIGDACCCIDRGNTDDIIGPAGPIDIEDLTAMVAYLFTVGFVFPCPEQADVDGLTGPAGPIDISDLTYLVAYLFTGGPPPPAC